MIRVIFIPFLILIASCSSKVVQVDYKPLKIDLPTLPHLPIYTITDKSTYDEVVKKYFTTVYIQKKYIDEINKIIK